MTGLAFGLARTSQCCIVSSLLRFVLPAGPTPGRSASHHGFPVDPPLLSLIGRAPDFPLRASSVSLDPSPVSKLIYEVPTDDSTFFVSLLFLLESDGSYLHGRPWISPVEGTFLR